MFEKDKKINYEASKEALIANGLHMIKLIYENRSSDEYKSHGDIKLVSEYHSIDKMVNDLPMIKKLPEDNAKNVKQLFLTLHRDVWSKQVSAYIVKPDEVNSVYTAFYTVGYRILVAELGAIYASIDYKDDGTMVYNPDKLTERKDMSEFIGCFNDDLDKNIAEFAKNIKIEGGPEPTNEKPPIDLPMDKKQALEPKTESYRYYQETAGEVDPKRLEELRKWPKDRWIEECGSIGTSKVILKTKMDVRAKNEVAIQFMSLVKQTQCTLADRVKLVNQLSSNYAINIEERNEAINMANRCGESNPSIKNKNNGILDKTTSYVSWLGAQLRYKACINLVKEVFNDSEASYQVHHIGPFDKDESEYSMWRFKNGDDTQGILTQGQMKHVHESYDFDDEDTYHVYTESVESVLDTVDKILTPITAIIDKISIIFKGMHGIKPMSLINYILTSSYNKKVDKFKEIAGLYETTKEAYANYQKRAKRDPAVEKKYKKDIASLNIKMKNLEASIKHFDSRAREEGQENLSKIDSKIKDSKGSSSTSKDTSSSSTTKSSDDVTDFDF